MARTDLTIEPSRMVSTLVRDIHAASANTDEWPGVLGNLRKFLNARVVTLGYHEFTTGSDSALLASPDDADFGNNMASFAARNPWFLSSEDYLSGRVMTGDELISPRDLRRTDFYRGFLQPRGLLHRLCGVVAQRACGAHLFSAYRAEDQVAFGTREKAELAVLLDHITLSLESQWRWQEADDLACALLAHTDHDANPVILVTDDAEPVYRNRAADQMFERDSGLCLDGARLVAANPVDQRLLRESITQAALSDPARPVPAVVNLAGPAPASPLVVVVRAAGRVFMRWAGVHRNLVLLTVRGGHATHDPASCAFAQQHDLTAAQARVSALVFSGQSLAHIAQSLNVSENTVRSHLKQIFQKTATHGQMELVHLHARVCQTLF